MVCSPNAPTGAVVEHLAAAGVAVKAYPRTGVRITVGTGQDTDHLLAAWPQPLHGLRRPGDPPRSDDERLSVST